MTALTGAGLTGSYIFSQTIFSMRAGVHTRVHGAIIAGAALCAWCLLNCMRCMRPSSSLARQYMLLLMETIAAMTVRALLPSRPMRLYTSLAGELKGLRTLSGGPLAVDSSKYDKDGTGIGTMLEIKRIELGRALLQVLNLGCSCCPSPSSTTCPTSSSGRF